MTALQSATHQQDTCLTAIMDGKVCILTPPCRAMDLDPCNVNQVGDRNGQCHSLHYKCCDKHYSLLFVEFLIWESDALVMERVAMDKDRSRQMSSQSVQKQRNYSNTKSPPTL